MIETIVIGVILATGVFLVGGIVRFFLFNKNKKSLKLIFSDFYYLNHIGGLVTISIIVLLWKVLKFFLKN